MGFGSPTKAITFINFFKINKILSYIVDDNKLKQNLYLPSMNIKILNPNYILANKPEIVLILAWNFKDSIIKKYKVFKKFAKFVVPLPKLKIYE